MDPKTSGIGMGRTTAIMPCDGCLFYTAHPTCTRCGQRLCWACREKEQCCCDCIDCVIADEGAH